MIESARSGRALRVSRDRVRISGSTHKHVTPPVVLLEGVLGRYLIHTGRPKININLELPCGAGASRVPAGRSTNVRSEVQAESANRRIPRLLQVFESVAARGSIKVLMILTKMIHSSTNTPRLDLGKR